jgi:Flp pilus assembly protein TadD
VITRWQPSLLNAPRAAALLALAEHRLEQGRYAQAAPLYQELHATKPNDPGVLLHWGFCLENLGELDEAAARYREALELEADFFEAHVNLAGLLWRLEDPAGSLVQARKAVVLQPDHPYAVRILGTALLQLNQVAQAQAELRRALEIKPDFGLARLDLALALLMNGQLQDGCLLYSHRWEDSPVLARPEFWRPEQQWRGPQKQPLQGRCIVVYAEQGLGDVIQFIRYVPLLQAQGAQVFAVVQSALANLLACMPGLVCVSGLNMEEGWKVDWHMDWRVDLQVALLDLPLYCASSLETLPAQVPYLSAPTASDVLWQQRLLPWQNQLKIGLAWAGQPHQVNDRNRSLRLSDFWPLFELGSLQWFSLQKNDGGVYTDTTPSPLNWHDFTADWQDFCDSAAQIQSLDLVITVCSAVAHLAGALGKPVWVLLPPNADWRWLLDRDDSPWYPTMRLFRRDFGEPRAAQVQRVLQALQATYPDRI